MRERRSQANNAAQITSAGTYEKAFSSKFQIVFEFRETIQFNIKLYPIVKSDLCSKERIIDFPNSKNKMLKYLVVIVYSVGVAVASYLWIRSLSEGFYVQKYWTNYQSSLSVRMMEILITGNGSNIKKPESVLNYRIKQYQAIKSTAISFVTRIKFKTQSLKIFPFLSQA